MGYNFIGRIKVRQDLKYFHINESNWYVVVQISGVSCVQHPLHYLDHQQIVRNSQWKLLNSNHYCCNAPTLLHIVKIRRCFTAQNIIILTLCIPQDPLESSRQSNNQSYHPQYTCTIKDQFSSVMVKVRPCSES